MNDRVELIYDVNCPNVSSAREALIQAFARAGVSASWLEWDRTSPESPRRVRGYGSPTILIDGKDVDGAEPGTGGESCRLYRDGASGFRGVPVVDQIVAALRKGHKAAAPFGWHGLLAVTLGIGASLLPVATCPACWLASSGLLATVGLGFLMDETSLVPVTVAFLGLVLASLGYRATSRRGYGPLAVGVVAVGLILSGKFWLFSRALLSVGLVLLTGASLWNAWARTAPTGGCCKACAPQEPVAKPLNT
jgi:mercuric ion transport protein